MRRVALMRSPRRLRISLTTLVAGIAAVKSSFDMLVTRRSHGCEAAFGTPLRIIGGLTFWLILVPGFGGGGTACTIVMVGKRLRNPTIGSQTSPVR